MEHVDLLRKCMYGTVDASARWQAHFAQILEDHERVQGLGNPSLFVLAKGDVRLLVRVDDFMVEMSSREEKMVLKCPVLQVRLVVHGGVPFRWQYCDGSFIFDPCDPVESHNWEGRVTTLVVKRPKSEELLLLAGAKPLNAEDTTLCRSSTMRVNYLSVDGPDLSFAAGLLARGMKNPATKNFKELKRGGRYLRGATGWSDCA